MKSTIFNTSILLVFWTLALNSLAANNSAPPTIKSYSFAVVPQQAASRLLREWGPVLQYLQQKTGYRFYFKTAPDIPTFEARLAKGEYDFAYMNPYHFTVFNDGEGGYQAVVKAKNKVIQGIIVVRKDSTISSVAELANDTLAFPAPGAFAASILPRGFLTANHIAFNLKYVSSHDSVYKSVAKGLYIAGGGVIRTLNALEPEVRDKLRILWTSEKYTPHAIAMNSSLDTSVLKQVQHALSELDQDDPGRILLAPLKLTGFEAAINADWDDVRALELDLHLGQKRQGG